MFDDNGKPLYFTAVQEMRYPNETDFHTHILLFSILIQINCL